MFTQSSKRFLNILILSLLLLVGVYSDEAAFEDCPHEPLPKHLNDISYLGVYNETHIHGTFVTDVTTGEETIEFTVYKKSHFRVYVAPHEVDVDLYLYNAVTEDTIEHSSLEIGTEEVIDVTIDPGSYLLRFSFFGVIFGSFDPTICDTVVMELEIVSLDVLSTRVANYHCPTAENLPSIPKENLTQVEHFEYKPNTSFNIINPQENAVSSRAVRWVEGFNFTLAEVKGQLSLWEVYAEIGYNFGTSGSLGLLITHADLGVPVVSCYTDVNCTVGMNERMNEIVLKTMLGPGSYTLWIYDQYGEKDVTLSTCSPFTFYFKIDIEDVPQNFLTCNAPEMPTRLIPGLFDEPKGFLHYSENVLVDLANGERSMPFSLDTDTYVKVLTAPHRIDIDIKIINTDTSAVVEYALSWGGEEAIVTYLPAGNYALTIVFFGAYEFVFCETFYLEIALAPKIHVDISKFCSQDTSSPPDLSAMDVALHSPAAAYTLNNTGPYYFAYPKDPHDNTAYQYSQVEVYRKTFQVTQTSVLKVLLGKSFLFGDLNMYLNSTRGKFYATHERNAAYLYAPLEPATYDLIIVTGTIQSYSPSLLQHFPHCLEYNLELSVFPKHSENECSRYRTLPSTFNSIQFLGHDSIVHFDQDFLAGITHEQTHSVQQVPFTVSQPSYFRVWSEPHLLDVDFTLIEDGNHVAYSSLWNEEEELDYVLSAGKNYIFQLDYYRWPHTDPHQVDPPCYVFHLELAISPLVFPDNAPCEVSLPPANLIPNNQPTFYMDNRYMYQQTQDPLTVYLPFTVTEMMEFRAEIRYDFVWSDLSLLLLVNNQTHTFAESYYDRQDLTTLLLAPGSYALEVHEAEPQDNKTLQRCASFYLTVAYRTQSAPVDPNAYEACPDGYLPDTFDAIPHLSELTGNKIHFARNILIDVSGRVDSTTFTLSYTSIFSMFIPPHGVVDIDLLLRNGSGILQASTGFEEELILLTLSPGQYKLETRYYGRFGSKLPAPEECASFPAEISITPVTAIVAPVSISTPCTTTRPPTTLQFAQSVFNSYSRSMADSTPFVHTISFSVESISEMIFSLRYEFVAGPLTLELVGTIVEGQITVNRTYFSSVGYNHAWFTRWLMPGSYVLTIADPTPVGFYPTMDKCTPYSIAYFINATTPPPGFCDDTEEMPTDLFSIFGGSYAYGGPQNPDGSVRIFGDNFLLSDVDGKHHYILFKIYQPSFVRLFASTEWEADIDFFVYSNTNRTVDSLVYFSMGTDDVESGLFLLQPQAAPYLLDVYFFSVQEVESDICPTFHFELAIKTNTTVAQELRCPNLLPYPEVPPVLIDADELYWLEESYVFTSARIAGNTVGDVFTYRITLDASYNTTIFTSVSFDFLANDFRLTLSDAVSGAVLETGLSDGTETENDYINFENGLWAMVPPGTYYLDISEDLGAKEDFDFSEVCHRFEFFLAIIPWNDNVEAGEITSVVPATGQNLNPYSPLVLTITFSQPVKQPSGNLLAWLRDQQVVYLVDTASQLNTFSPATALFDSSREVLGVTFNGLLVSKTYNLVIDAGKFTTDGGSAFTMDSSHVHTYSMSACSCSGHGTCQPNSVHCACNPGYAGDDCSVCDIGYHFANTLCVADEKCTPDTCHGHGTCTDAGGSTTCTCDPGYATHGTEYCTICAFGYTGYPNCTSKDQSDQRSTRCTAPLLPENLNDPAYLGYNGEVHLSGNYFIDIDAYYHDTVFTLTTDSLFRVYSEPHRVDIDLWLYSLLDDGTINKAIDYGISIGDEEVLFHVLNTTVATKYMVRFRYYVWRGVDVTNCETFRLELALKPLNRAISEASKMNSDCGNADKFPAFPGVDPNNFYLIPQDGLGYTPTDVYNVHSRVNPPDGANFFHNISFSLNPPPNKFALVHVEVGYRFLVGDLALLLEQGTKKAHCPGDEVGCIAGSNTMNRNILRRLLPAGNYTLWFYEPEPQKSAVSQCSPFTFSFSVEYRDMQEDIYYCDSAILPTSFNAPGYLHFGRMHVQDRFLMFNSTSIQFSLEDRSFFRAAGHSQLVTALQVINSATGSIVAQSSYALSTQLFADLPSGSYTLFIDAILSSYLCPYVDLEVAIFRAEKPFFHECHGGDSLPALSNIAVPFHFPQTKPETPAAFFALLNNEVIRQYPFTIDQVAVIEIALDSDFITSGLSVVVEGTRQGSNKAITLYGVHSYNRNYLRDTIEPGTYKLKILRPGTPVLRPTLFPPCAEFNFEFHLWSLSDLQANPCLSAGQDLPLSLNSMRYVRSQNIFGYQSETWRVPQFSGFLFHYIDLRVANSSLFRIYTEPHVVDIDLALYQAGSTIPLANAGYEISTEESLVWLLEPNVDYSIELIFWKFGTEIPACPLFNMEIAVVPANPANVTCHGGGDHWPPQFPSTLGLPFHYSSLDIGEHLYYQQRIDSERIYDMPFTLTTQSKLYAGVKYHFATGDLVLRLKNADTGTLYFGDNALNGDILRLTGLNPGNYILSLYEATKNIPSHMSCSYFSFTVTIEADVVDPSRSGYPSLPSGLNTIPYLAYEGKVHILDHFSVVPDAGGSKTSISIADPSLFRISLDYDKAHTNPFEITLSSSAGIIATGGDTLMQLLSKGTYSLSVAQAGVATTSLVTLVELAISPMSAIADDISHFIEPPSCADTKLPSVIQPSPSGSFQYLNSDILVSGTTLTHSQTLQSFSMTLTNYTVLYAKSGSDFLLNDLRLNVIGVQSGTGNVVTVAGRMGSNINEINEVLPPGTYHVNIFQSTIFPTPYYNQIPHCTTYSLRVTLQGRDTEDHVDCASYHMIPWDLNTAQGGSVPYGGPIDGSGSVHIWGDSFLAPLGPNRVDKITFTISADTLMSVVHRERYFGEISNAMSSGTTNTAVTPTITVSDYNQRGEFFLLKHQGTQHVGSTTFNLELHYGITSTVNCPYFGLQLAMKPLTYVQNSLVCPSTSSGLPKQTVLVNGVYSEYLDSAFTDAAVFGNSGTPAEFKYEIDLNITQPSNIIASLSYNSLVSMFNLQLYSVIHDVRLISGSGEWQMQRVSYGQTNLNQVISGSLRTGRYVLVISQPASQRLPFSTSTGQSLCYPFIWNLQVVAQDYTPYVTSVTPSSADMLSPLVPLEVDLTFSSGVFNAQKTPVSGDYLTPVLNAFYLTPYKGDGSIKFNPISGVKEGGLYRLIFNGTFVSKQEYVLGLRPQIIYDGSQNEIKLISINRYKMIDTSCSGKGQFQYNWCLCSSGYAGPECAVCDIDYVNVAPDGQPIVCKHKISEKCLEDTCGCDPLISTSCVPLGTCDDSNGTAICHCRLPYAGDHCDKCAAGYQNYAEGCPQSAQCPVCVRGFCDVATFKCVCPDHFAGSTCDECADGWAGDECATPVNSQNQNHNTVDDTTWTNVLNSITIILVIFAVLIIIANIGFFIYRRRAQKISRYTAVFETLDAENAENRPPTQLDDLRDTENGSRGGGGADSTKSRLVTLDD